MDKDLEKNKKLEEVLSNKDFLCEIFQMKNDDEIIQRFKSEGIDVTKEDCAKIKEESNTIFKELEKLDDDTLKKLSGGIGWGSLNPCNWFKSESSNFQKIKDAASDAAIQQISNPAVAQGIVQGVGNVANKVIDHFIPPAQCKPAAEPAPKVIVKENNNNSFMLGATSAVAVTAVAGLIYSNRKKIKRMFRGDSK